MKVSYKENCLRKRLRSVANTMFNRLDNNNNASFSSNGEKAFLHWIAEKYKTQTNFTVFDVGANIGHYALLVREIFSQSTIHLFEPQQDCFNEIQILFKEDKQCKINHFGLSDNETKALIYRNNNSKSPIASLYQRDLSFSEQKFQISEEIQLKTAKQYLDVNNINKIHLLKIDIEGHEYNALKGFGDFLNNEKIDFIQFEYGGCNIDSHVLLKDYYEFFEQKGFALYKIFPNKLVKRDYQPWMENFNYSNYVAVSNNITL